MHIAERKDRRATGSLIDVDIRGRSLEPPVDRPLEPLKHQMSI